MSPQHTGGSRLGAGSATARALFLLSLLVPVTLCAAENAAAGAVPLSLAEATRRALEHNTSLLVERENLNQAVSGVMGARGAYDIVWDGSVQWRRNTDPVNSTFSGAPPGLLAPENEGVEGSTRFSQLLPTGGAVSLFGNMGRSTTNGVFTILSPAFDTGLGVSVRQPLLRNLFMDPAREAIRVAAADRDLSQARLRRVVTDTVARVDQAYWNLVAARRNVVSLDSAVALAARQLSETRTRVEAGALAKTDVAEPTAELERRKGDLALARRTVEDAENTLKLLVLGDPRDPDWAADLVPSDAPETAPATANLDEALATALANRPEIAEARAVSDRATARVDARRSDLLPSIDLVGSYQRRGLAGTANPDAINFNSQPVVVPPPLDGGIGRSYGTIRENQFPDASVGVVFSVPLGNRTARANLAIARSQLSQASIGISAAEQQAQAEVRNAVSALETAAQRNESARASREAAETQLMAEQERFAAGLSTNFLVLTRQNELTNARVTETSALTDYRKAWTELARSTGALLAERGVTIAEASTSVGVGADGRAR